MVRDNYIEQIDSDKFCHMADETFPFCVYRVSLSCLIDEND